MMEFYQLDENLKDDILNQLSKALLYAITELNKDFSKIMYYNHWTSSDLKTEEKGKITTLLDRIISGHLVKKFNKIGRRTGITLIPQNGLEGHGKDYILHIERKLDDNEIVEYLPEIIEISLEQKINNQQKGDWLSHKYSEKVDTYLLIELGKISIRKGVTRLWAGIFDKASAESEWTEDEVSGFTHLKVRTTDEQHLYVLIGRIKKIKQGGRPRKYIRPIYSIVK